MVERRSTPVVTAGRVIYLAVCLFASAEILAGGVASESEEPLWKNNIQQELSTYAGVSFIDNEKLLAYELDRTGPAELSSRDPHKVSGAFRLHASLLYARSGKLLLTRDWGAALQDAEIKVMSSGVLVKSAPGATIKVYSSDLEWVRNLPLALADPDGNSSVSISRSGRTVAMSQFVKKGNNYVSHVDVLDADTLRTRYSWDQSPAIVHFSMSDEGFITTYQGVVALTEFRSPERSKVLSVLDKSERNCFASVAAAVISDQLIVLRDCKEVELLTSSGVSFSLGPFNGHGSTASPFTPCRPHNSGRAIAVASGGGFVAVTLPRLKIKKSLLAERRSCLDGLQVAVYSVALKKRVLAVNIDPLPDKDYDVALSPDGSKLAILNDRTLSLYAVP
jgi:hypothetical protein